MLRIAVCDDLSVEREKIRHILEEEFASGNMAAEFLEFDSGSALVSAWERDKLAAQIIFLDIYMDGIDGVETARRLRDMGCKSAIIFLTSTPDFAMEGYEVDAAGYLLKPLEEENLRQLLKRLFKRNNPALLALRQGNQVFTLAPSEIIYVESNRNRLLIHTLEDTITYYGRLDELAERLSGKQFLRCHQSYLVNMDRVFAAGDDFHMETGDVVPIRVRERRAIREKYFRYIMEKSL